MVKSFLSSASNFFPYRLKLQTWSTLALLTMVSMELSWVTLWFRLLIMPRQEVGYWHAFLVFGGILLAIYFADELLSRRDTTMGRRRLVLAVMILLCMLITLTAFLNPSTWLDLKALVKRLVESFQVEGALIPVEFLILAMAVVISWRGLSLAGRLLEPSTVQRGFRTGIVMLFFYGLIVKFEEGSQGGAFYLFLFSGLMAMGAARLSMQGRLRGGKSIPFDRKWLIGLCFACTFVVGLSYLAISWLTGQGLDQLYTLYRWVMSILVWLISPILYIVAVLIRWLSEKLEFGLLLNNLLELFQRLRSAFFEFMDMIQRWFNYLGTLIHWQITSLRIPKAWVLWGTILFLFMLMLLTLRRYVWNRETGGEEDLSSLEETDLLTLLRAAIRKTLEQLLGRVEDLFNMSHARRLLRAARIRRVYARLLRLSARLGTSRPAARTPLEFLPNLQKLFPDFPTELETITQAYMRVRYGELPETKEEVQIVEQAWTQISSSDEVKRRPRLKPLRN